MSYKFDARGAFLPKFLGFIMVLFIGILIAAALISGFVAVMATLKTTLFCSAAIVAFSVMTGERMMS